ncbi:hypothetical protein GLOIN_2v1763770 [Rhizophagus clarus]|uniref:Uncharacterized protein n=1 Tax=Rhizophagus clarus TaxID=94130 RepID=A0A8H3MFA4_9GLOM|nr:hypothetical protein GLOIN_2v1763770 [Rhizophagus clarus]
MEQTYSDTSAGDKIEVYEFLEALRLLNNKVALISMDDDDNTESDINEEIMMMIRAIIGILEKDIPNGNIVLMEFTRRLPDISDREKNRLFDAFSRSNTFGVKEYNALLNALADPEKGWDLDNY